jgi:hypothetical protein
MGVRLRVSDASVADMLRPDQPLTLDVKSDAEGEFFDIRLASSVELAVVDVRRREQHLLLQARAERDRHYYLCGHDEMHWFVAAIPERVGALTNVFSAMEALKPAEVLEAQRQQGIKGKDRQRRKNAAYVRQGEWFFLPMPKLHVPNKKVLYDEPLSRGVGSKPHICEFLYRKGGETVYVCDEFPQGLATSDYVDLLRSKPRAKNWNWRRMQRNAAAYAKGKVSHPDHKTIHLYGWYTVLMNTEGEAQAMRHVVFLD